MPRWDEGLQETGYPMTSDLDRSDFCAVSKHLAPIYRLSHDGGENGKKFEL